MKDCTRESRGVKQLSCVLPGVHSSAHVCVKSHRPVHQGKTVDLLFDSETEGCQTDPRASAGGRKTTQGSLGRPRGLLCARVGVKQVVVRQPQAWKPPG